MTTSTKVLEQAALSVETHKRIRGWLNPTPCITSRQPFSNGSSLFYKAENFQQTKNGYFHSLGVVCAQAKNRLNNFRQVLRNRGWLP